MKVTLHRGATGVLKLNRSSGGNRWTFSSPRVSAGWGMDRGCRLVGRHPLALDGSCVLLSGVDRYVGVDAFEPGGC